MAPVGRQQKPPPPPLHAHTHNQSRKVHRTPYTFRKTDRPSIQPCHRVHEPPEASPTPPLARALLQTSEMGHPSLRRLTLTGNGIEVQAGTTVESGCADPVLEHLQTAHGPDDVVCNMRRPCLMQWARRFDRYALNHAADGASSTGVHCACMQVQSRALGAGCGLSRRRVACVLFPRLAVHGTP